MPARWIGRFDPALQQDNMDDFNRRYHSTWLRVVVNGIDDIFLYSGQDDDGHLQFRNPDYGNITLKTHTEANVRAFYPPLGYFNKVGDNGKLDAIYCFKRAERINRRSCNDRHVHFIDPTTYLLRRGGNVPLRHSIIHNSIVPVYPKDIADGVGKLSNPHTNAVALNREYALFKGDKGAVYIGNGLCIIGLITPNLQAIEVSAHFEQELKDYVRDTHQKIKITATGR